MLARCFASFRAASSSGPAARRRAAARLSAVGIGRDSPGRVGSGRAGGSRGGVGGGGPPAPVPPPGRACRVGGGGHRPPLPATAAGGPTLKIYTKTGDNGTTGLLGAGRVGKDDPRIEAYGTVDELNAVLGI